MKQTFMFYSTTCAPRPPILCFTNEARLGLLLSAEAGIRTGGSGILPYSHLDYSPELLPLEFINCLVSLGSGRVLL